MTEEVVFATTNPHKIERFKAYFQPLGLKVITPPELNHLEVAEDGKTPKENATKKAMAGFKVSGKPTFGVDYWLRIEGFPQELQPGPYVRRIFLGSNNEHKDATDEEMLNYYTEQIAKLGGKTNGTWISAIALVINPSLKFSESFQRETIFTSVRSPNTTPGEPLNSIQIDPTSGKYFADLKPEEWFELQKRRERRYIEFMKSHLPDIEYSD